MGRLLAQVASIEKWDLFAEIHKFQDKSFEVYFSPHSETACEMLGYTDPVQFLIS